MRVRSMSSWWALALVAVVACDPGSGGRADGAESKVAAAERRAPVARRRAAPLLAPSETAEVPWAERASRSLRVRGRPGARRRGRGSAR